MPLETEVLSEIRDLVRAGFEDRDRIAEIMCEELHEPDELDAAEVQAALDAALADHEKEQAGWPVMTDCDRLDRVFEALGVRGIVALQNAGYTQSDGYDDANEARLARGGSDTPAIGYCFYHGQDLERALQGGGLYLAFGPFDAAQEQTEGPRLGAAVVEELARAGLASEWNGTFDQRIHVPRIDWKRRR